MSEGSGRWGLAAVWCGHWIAGVVCAATVLLLSGFGFIAWPIDIVAERSADVCGVGVYRASPRRKLFRRPSWAELERLLVLYVRRDNYMERLVPLDKSEIESWRHVMDVDDRALCCKKPQWNADFLLLKKVVSHYRSNLVFTSVASVLQWAMRLRISIWPNAIYLQLRKETIPQSWRQNWFGSRILKCIKTFSCSTVEHGPNIENSQWLTMRICVVIFKSVKRKIT